MKKFAVSVLAFFCAVSMAACADKNIPKDTAQTKENTEATVLEGEKNWSEQEIIYMFKNLNSTDNLTYLDCVLIPDKASGRVGAVLFEDKTKEITSVAFLMPTVMHNYAVLMPRLPMTLSLHTLVTVQ